MPVFDVEVVERATARTLGVRKVEAPDADSAAQQVISPGCLAGRVTRSDIQPTPAEIATVAARETWEFFDRLPRSEKKGERSFLLMTERELGVFVRRNIAFGLLYFAVVVVVLQIALIVAFGGAAVLQAIFSGP